MEIAKVIINGNEARAVDGKAVTKGMAGATVRVEYNDPVWDGLNKMVVFSGAEEVGFLCNDNVVEVPPEAVAIDGPVLRFGVCGTDRDGKLVIPTKWADLGTVLKGVPVNPQKPGAPTPPTWAQILGMIGDMKALETEAKDTLVSAINEAAKTGSGGTGGGTDGGLSITDDGNGNVIIVASGSVTIMDDGEGNVIIA